MGWNSQDDQGGYIVGLSTWLGGGSNPTETYGSYYVEGYHSGVGTGARFQVHRDSNGNILDVAINHSGYGYTGGELITIPAESIGAPVGQDMIVRPYVHSVMNGAVSYAISCTHTSGSDFAVEGTDRNGVVSVHILQLLLKKEIPLHLIMLDHLVVLICISLGELIRYYIKSMMIWLLCQKSGCTTQWRISCLDSSERTMENILCVIQTIILDLVRLNKPLSLSNQHKIMM